MSRFFARPLIVPVSIVAGLLGGTVAPYIFPGTSAEAQILAPKTLEAGTFRLVTNAGHLAGSLTIDAAGNGVVTMFDADGKVIFTSDNKPVLKPAAGR